MNSYFFLLVDNDCRLNSPERPDGFPLVCEDKLGGCFDYAVCDGTAEPQSLRLCVLTTECTDSVTGANSSISICDATQLFEAHSGQCYGIADGEI